MSCKTSTGVNDNGNDGGGGDSLYSKKLKRQKIPKRGPGVAELEKILREQDRKDDHLAGSSSISSSLKNAVPFSVDHEQFITPSTGGNVRDRPSSAGVNNDIDEGIGVSHARRSGIVLPEDASSPAMWSSHEINSTDFEGIKLASGFTFSTQITNRSSPIIPSLVIPQKHRQNIPAMIDPFGHPGLSSLPSVVAGANYHHTEPPSNQISCFQCSHAWPQQEEMVLTTRCWPFSTNNPRNQVQIFSYTKRCLTDCTPEAPYGKIFMFGSPATPIINEGCGQGVIKFESLPFQKTMESWQRSMETHRSSVTGPAGLVHKKPFYNFFAPEEEMNWVDTSIRLKTERVEARGDDIDLNFSL